MACIALISLLTLRFILPKQNLERPLTAGGWNT